MAGVGSRRKNDELILSGAVKVNGRSVHELGVRVDPLKDHVSVNGKLVALTQKNVYILLNKPKDCITTLSDEKGRRTVMDYVKVKERVYPVGRLDRNTTGVLILTNDGDFANSLMHPRGGIERVYRVTLNSPVKDVHVGALRKGVRLEDGPAKALAIEVIKGSDRKKVTMAILEGRNREVKRMFEVLGYDVKQLDRVSFGGLTAQGLQRGKWRYLNNDEVRFLKQLAESNGSARVSR